MVAGPAVGAAELAELRARIDDLASRGRAADTEMERLAEENAVLLYKNRLLTELLAVAQLDAEEASAALRNEKLRVEALKWELARLSLGEMRHAADAPDGRAVAAGGR